MPTTLVDGDKGGVANLPSGGVSNIGMVLEATMEMEVPLHPENAISPLPLDDLMVWSLDLFC